MIKRYAHKSNRRVMRVRAKTKGTGVRPRLTVFRSLKLIYAQVIDDSKGITLASAFGPKPAVVGEAVAKNALKVKVNQVVFDRGPYQYHGRIQALADAARKAGLKF